MITPITSDKNHGHSLEITTGNIFLKKSCFFKIDDGTTSVITISAKASFHPLILAHTGRASELR